MLRRVKIRRNGHATGGKVALVADNWALMLQRCGSKLSTDASQFVATRLFTADGFEIEALEEVRRATNVHYHTIIPLSPFVGCER